MDTRYHKAVAEHDFITFIKVMKAAAHAQDPGDLAESAVQRLLKLKQTGDFPTFHTTFSNILQELKEAGETFKDPTLRTFYLDALNQEQFRVPLENYQLLRPKPSFEDLCKSIMEFYHQSKRSSQPPEARAARKGAREHDEVQANALNASAGTEQSESRGKKHKNKGRKGAGGKQSADDGPKPGVKAADRDETAGWTCANPKCELKGQWHPRGQHKYLVTCQYCDGTGHRAKECPVLEGKTNKSASKPSGGKPASKKAVHSAFASLNFSDDSEEEDASPTVWMHMTRCSPCDDVDQLSDADCSENACDDKDKTQFILDSGCTNGNGINDLSLLSNVKASKTAVQTADGTRNRSTHVGDLPLAGRSVFCADLQHNLISTSAMCQLRNLITTEDGNELVVMDKETKTVLLSAPYVANMGYVTTLADLKLAAARHDNISAATVVNGRSTVVYTAQQRQRAFDVFVLRSWHHRPSK